MFTVNAVKRDMKGEGKPPCSRPPTGKAERADAGKSKLNQVGCGIPRGPGKDNGERREAALVLINTEHKAGEMQLEASRQVGGSTLPSCNKLSRVHREHGFALFPV